MKLKVAQASAALVIRHGASRLAMWAGGECQHFDRPTVSSRYACTRILLCVPLQLVCMPCLVWWRQRHAHTQHLCSGCKWRASVRLDLGAECLCGLDVSHRLQPDCVDPVGSLLRRLPRSSSPIHRWASTTVLQGPHVRPSRGLDRVALAVRTPPVLHIQMARLDARADPHRWAGVSLQSARPRACG
jgi:hypothetical protein